MKEKILNLRKTGLTYREIEKKLGCSRSLIAYYISPSVKKKKNEKQNRNRFQKRKNLKMSLGGKCSICGYNKCLDALHFHHKDEGTKSFGIASAIWGNHKTTEEKILKEVSKCILLCANCHAEIHSLEYGNGSGGLS